MLEPSGGITGSVLDFQYLHTAPIFIGLQHCLHIGISVLGKGVSQIDRVFQGEFGAAADRVVRSVCCVTHQHNRNWFVTLSMRPMHPAFAYHPRKLYPDGRAAQVCGIAHQSMTVEVFGK